MAPDHGYFPHGSVLRRVHRERSVGLLYGQRALAIGAIDYVFPFYLSNVSVLRAGTTFVFILIVLVWFYVIALVLLAGAVVNELRFEARQAPD